MEREKYKRDEKAGTRESETVSKEKEAEEERGYERREEMARVTEKWRGNWG